MAHPLKLTLQTLAILAFAHALPQVAQALEAKNIPRLDEFIPSEAPLSAEPKYIGPRHYFDYELWTQAKPWSYTDKLAIRVVAKRRFPRSKAIREMVEEAVELHSIDEGQQNRLHEFIAAAFAIDIAQGDRFDFCWDPTRGLAIYRNDELRAATADQSLCIWILDFFCHEEERDSKLLEHKAPPR